jgi:pilus assembly protein TadC
VEPKIIIVVGLAILAAAIGLGLIYFLTSSSKSNMQNMLDASSKESIGGVVKDPEIEKMKLQVKNKAKSASSVVSLEEKLFRGGIFGEQGRADFYRWRMLAPLILGPIMGLGFGFYGGLQLGILGALLGGGIGYQLPISWLDRKIASRSEDIMFYLPLVIEQISIGVSSSLDVGPCLQKVVQMADERDTHNIVTELLKYAQNYIKTGVPFEEAMVETGKASGHTELKHAFMYLAQVAKHGGEITRQLQELAESVAGQRQAYIEGRIKQLELKATGPVALVFVGFIIIIMTGFGLKLGSAL